jgi:hypothetical protein
MQACLNGTAKLLARKGNVPHPAVQVDMACKSCRPVCSVTRVSMCLIPNQADLLERAHLKRQKLLGVC